MATESRPVVDRKSIRNESGVSEDCWDVPKWNRHATRFADVAKHELSETDKGVEAEKFHRIAGVADVRLPGSINSSAQSEPVEGRLGLALSGGGIRSATFSLGVIQSLATHDHLQRFDYLSTVSGGGYAGSWLTAWIARSKDNGGFDSVIKALKQNSSTGATEPEQVQWLRRYSNYLTPRVGALSMDAVTIAVTWIRNTMLNLITLIAVVSFALMIPMIMRKVAIVCPISSNQALAFALIMAIASLATVAFNLRLRNYSPFQQSTARSANKPLWCQWLLEPRYVSALAIAPGFLAAVAACRAIFSQSVWNTHHTILMTSIGIGLFSLVVGSLWILAGVIDTKNAKAYASVPEKMRAVKHVPSSSGPTFSRMPVFGCAAVVGAAVAAALLLLANHVGPQRPLWGFSSNPMALATRILTFGPPIAMICLGTGYAVAIGLVGRAYSESSREWLSRFGGALIAITACWLLWMSLTFYAPGLADRFFSGKTLSLIGGWIASVIGAIGLGTFQSKSKSQSLAPWRGRLISLLSIVIAAGAFIGISCLLNFLLGALVNSVEGGQEVSDASGLLLGSALAACALLALVFAWRVDINKFSLHDMYKLRIIRCYLGASNKSRSAQPFTGFDPSDDIPLKDCADQRPFHIINTALNVTQGAELAWQQRKAGSFTMTPAYCGYELSSAQMSTVANAGGGFMNGFTQTADYASKDDEGLGLSLGMAIATSGAAVSPNMGANSHPALAILLTILNLRLGRWCPNPASSAYKRSSPTFGLRYLLSELFGFSSDKSKFVYLSDGGHFDNTGVYELVRRQCMRIVMVDAGADPRRSFQDFGNLVHKCRVDFGVEISLPLGRLFGTQDTRRSESGFESGTIDYGEGKIGQILVIKPSLSAHKDEPADIYHYSEAEPTFPQQSTADQWFDESQFESYRKLGFTLCSQALPADTTFFV